MKQKVTKLLMEMWKIVSLLVVCIIIVFVIKKHPAVLDGVMYVNTVC